MRELRGGIARSAQVAIRRRLNAEERFDAVTDYNLGAPMEQKRVVLCIRTRDVLAAITALSRRTAGPPSGINYRSDYQAGAAHDKEDRRHIAFGGEGALLQIT